MKKATQSKDFVPIDDIRDGVIVRKDGTLVAVILVNSINFSLKSEYEREAILGEFQNLLNSLGSSMQIIVQSRKLNIETYIKKLQLIHKKQQNTLLKIQTEEYIKFIEDFTKKIDILSKHFFVVITLPRSKVKKGGDGILSGILGGKKKASNVNLDFEEDQSQLEQRVELIRQGLSRVGLRSVQLGTEQVSDLFFQMLNPEE